MYNIIHMSELQMTMGIRMDGCMERYTDVCMDGCMDGQRLMYIAPAPVGLAKERTC